MNKYLSKIWKYIQTEPAIIFSVLGSGIALAASFGFSLTSTQTKAVYSFVAVVTGLLIRQTVSPTVQVQARLSAVESAVATLSPAPTQAPQPPQSPGSA